MIPMLRLGDHELIHVAATRTPIDADFVPLPGISALGRHRCRFRFSKGEMELTDSVADEADGWLPLEMHTAGQPSMPVRFGDIEVNGCWDTGANLTAVDAGFADAHPELFEPIRSAVGIDASGVEISGDLATLSACSIGDVKFPPTICAIVDLTALNEHVRDPSRKDVATSRCCSSSACP